MHTFYEIYILLYSARISSYTKYLTPITRTDSLTMKVFAWVFVAFFFVGTWTSIDSKPVIEASMLSDYYADSKPSDDFNDFNSAGKNFWGGKCSADSDCM